MRRNASTSYEVTVLWLISLINDVVRCRCSYPHSLYFLDLLKKPEFRTSIANPVYKVCRLQITVADDLDTSGRPRSEHYFI